MDRNGRNNRLPISAWPQAAKKDSLNHLFGSCLTSIFTQLGTCQTRVKYLHTHRHQRINTTQYIYIDEWFTYLSSKILHFLVHLIIMI